MTAASACRQVSGQALSLDDANVPGQQHRRSVHGVVSDGANDVVRADFGIEAIQLYGADQADRPHLRTRRRRRIQH